MVSGNTGEVTHPVHCLTLEQGFMHKAELCCPTPQVAAALGGGFLGS